MGRTADNDRRRRRCSPHALRDGIRAGTGGDEAALFARDLYEMYRRYADSKGWKTEIMDHSASELGGFKEITLPSKAKAFIANCNTKAADIVCSESRDRNARSHPYLCRDGRSAAGTRGRRSQFASRRLSHRQVLRIGSWWPHVNKTESAIRLTHHETGIVVQCQDEKSQHKNLAKALRVLKSRIYDKKREEDLAKRAETRQGLIGSGDRSQRIRTYNFPQNRLDDHRINLTLYKLDQIVGGDVSQ